MLTDTATAGSLRAFFEDLCQRYLVWATAEQRHRQTRDQALSALDFPFPSFRIGQRELAADVYRANARARHLMAQAPTGIGKTMATVFASLRAAPGHGTDRLLFLTARTTGRQLALDALHRLQVHAELAAELQAGAGAKLRELANTALGFLTKTRWTRAFHLPS